MRFCFSSPAVRVLREAIIEDFRLHAEQIPRSKSSILDCQSRSERVRQGDPVQEESSRSTTFYRNEAQTR